MSEISIIPGWVLFACLRPTGPDDISGDSHAKNMKGTSHTVILHACVAFPATFVCLFGLVCRAFLPFGQTVSVVGLLHVLWSEVAAAVAMASSAAPSTTFTFREQKVVLI